MTTQREADKSRDIIYTLYLRGFTQEEIGSKLDIHQSRVSRHLALARRRNIAWFDRHQDTDGRMRSLFKEVSDRINDTMRESWKLYEDTPAENVALRNTILKGIRQSIILYRKHQRMIIPSIEEVAQDSKVRKAIADIEEIKQMAKMRNMKTNDTNANPTIWEEYLKARSTNLTLTWLEYLKNRPTSTDNPSSSQSVKTKPANAKGPGWWQGYENS